MIELIAGSGIYIHTYAIYTLALVLVIVMLFGMDQRFGWGHNGHPNDLTWTMAALIVLFWLGTTLSTCAHSDFCDMHPHQGICYRSDQ